MRLYLKKIKIKNNKGETEPPHTHERQQGNRRAASASKFNSLNERVKCLKKNKKKRKKKVSRRINGTNRHILGREKVLDLQ